MLAIVAGALRRYLSQHRALPSRSLQAMVPIALPPRPGTVGNNHISGLLTTLATNVADPHQRLAEISRVTAAAKRRHEQAHLGALRDLADVVPPTAGRGLTQLMGQLGVPRWGPVLYNLVVSNVPGPETLFYCNGALVERAYPMGPVTDWGALNITVVSYRRHLTFGIVTCPDVVPDVERLIDALDAEILELHEATVAA